MTKTQKKRDKQIRLVLTNACENIKKIVKGFAYLTHTINFNDEEKTLTVRCYFDNPLALDAVSPLLTQLVDIILAELRGIKLIIKPNQVLFLAN